MIRAIVLAGATAFAFGVLYQVAWRMVTISAVIAALAWTAYQAILGSFSGGKNEGNNEEKTSSS